MSFSMSCIKKKFQNRVDAGCELHLVISTSCFLGLILFVSYLLSLYQFYSHISLFLQRHSCIIIFNLFLPPSIPIIYILLFIHLFVCLSFCSKFMPDPLRPASVSILLFISNIPRYSLMRQCLPKLLKLNMMRLSERESRESFGPKFQLTKFNIYQCYCEIQVQLFTAASALRLILVLLQLYLILVTDSKVKERWMNGRLR